MESSRNFRAVTWKLCRTYFFEIFRADCLWVFFFSSILWLINFAAFNDARDPYNCMPEELCRTLHYLPRYMRSLLKYGLFPPIILSLYLGVRLKIKTLGYFVFVYIAVLFFFYLLALPIEFFFDKSIVRWWIVDVVFFPFSIFVGIGSGIFFRWASDLTISTGEK